MNEIQLKSEFHKLIDEFKDVNVLEDFYEVIQEYSQHNQKDIIDELSDEQRARLFPIYQTK